MKPAPDDVIFTCLMLAALFCFVMGALSGCAWLNEPAFPPGYSGGSGTPEVPVVWNTNPPHTVYVLRGRVQQNQ
jgi:hypothetical protein